MVNVQRSVHQGGCASVQIFLLCAEVIALELRQCEAIKGIPVEEIIHLLNQYADDMNVASLYNQESLNAIFSKLELFRQNSGFSINYDKTAIYRMGPVVHASAEAVLYTASQVAWTSKPINVLGITVSHQQHEILNNYKVLAPKIRSVLNTWKGRNLSLMGKVLIINTLIGSLFVYRMSVLPTMPEDLLKTCESYFSDFIWNGRKAKIALKTLQKSKLEGGLNLVCLRSKDVSIKCFLAEVATSG